ncbi:unnamed protein product, partial [Cyprideis torosa]
MQSEAEALEAVGWKRKRFKIERFRSSALKANVILASKGRVIDPAQVASSNEKTSQMDAKAPRLPIYDGQCDPPFQPMKGSKCYFLSYGTFQRSWQTAQQLCRVLHPMGSLAEFEDLEELIDATLFLSNDDHNCRSWNSPGPWIGGMEIGDSNTFTWASTNSTIQNFNWAEGRPNSPSSNDGIALDCSAEFKWIDLDNTLELPFLCEIPPNPPAPTYTCPEGFDLVGKFCFATGSEPLTWDQAQSYCKSLTGTGKLVEIQTEEQMEQLKIYMADNSLGWRWIGAEQVPGADNVFRWTSTRRLVTVGDWLVGDPEPDDDGNQDVVEVLSGVQQLETTGRGTGVGVSPLPLQQKYISTITRQLSIFMNPTPASSRGKQCLPRHLVTGEWDPVRPEQDDEVLDDTGLVKCDAGIMSCGFLEELEAPLSYSFKLWTGIPGLNKDQNFERTARTGRLPLYDGQCDPPFRPMKGSKCYFLSYGTFERTWQTAQQLCRVLHPMGYLAEFQELEELIDATLFLSNDDHDCRSWTSPGPWIGGMEIGDSNTFTWASTNLTIQNFNWAEGRPNSASSNDGIALDCSMEFKWIDLDNSMELPFLCEIPPNPPAPTYTCPEGFDLVGKFCFATGSQTLTWDQAQSY